MIRMGMNAAVLGETFDRYSLLQLVKWGVYLLASPLSSMYCEACDEFCVCVKAQKIILRVTDRRPRDLLMDHIEYRSACLFSLSCLTFNLPTYSRVIR